MPQLKCDDNNDSFGNDHSGGDYSDDDGVSDSTYWGRW